MSGCADQQMLLVSVLVSFCLGSALRQSCNMKSQCTIHMSSKQHAQRCFHPCSSDNFFCSTSESSNHFHVFPVSMLKMKKLWRRANGATMCDPWKATGHAHNDGCHCNEMPWSAATVKTPKPSASNLTPKSDEQSCACTTLEQSTSQMWGLREPLAGANMLMMLSMPCSAWLTLSIPCIARSRMTSQQSLETNMASRKQSSDNCGLVASTVLLARTSARCNMLPTPAAKQSGFHDVSSAECSPASRAACAIHPLTATRQKLSRLLQAQLCKARQQIAAEEEGRTPAEFVKSLVVLQSAHQLLD